MYPVGIKFTPAHTPNSTDFCIITDDTIFEDMGGGYIYAAIPNGKYDYTHNSKYGNTTLSRVVWCNGVFAKIIGSVKSEVQEFKKGDYIVVLVPNNEWNNHIFKQREDNLCLKTELNLKGSSTDGWSAIQANRQTNWRYATQEEIKEYNRLGKPYDVTTLNIEVIPEYVECVKGSSNYKHNIVGRIYKVESYNPKTLRLEIVGSKISSINFIEPNVYNVTDYIISTKEAFDAQNETKKPESMKPEVVHCTTQEEWDFIVKTLNYKNFDYWNNYKEKSCIELGNRSYADTEGIAYGKGKATIYSFEEWCEKFNYTNPFISRPQELTSLPEKWFVRASVENRDILRKWRGGDYTTWHDDLIMLSHREWSSTKWIPKDYIEITFEEFKKWVMKEEAPKPEVLVFGKYKIGDIVVSLVNNGCHRLSGDMFRVLETSSNGNLYYKPSNNNSTASEWRATTPEEIEAYNQGITNINDIKSITKVEEGKWYRWVWTWVTPNPITYGKVSDVKSPSCFNVSEGHHQGSYSKDNGYFYKDCKDLQPASIEEIQFFLPDNHPDKIKNTQFEEGKWYRFTRGIGWKKFLRIEYDRWYYSEELYDFGQGYVHRKLEDWMVSYEANSLVDLSEIQKYLPDGHPDKIPTEKSLIGRYIKWLKNGEYDRKYSQGEYCKISKASSNSINLEGSTCSFGGIEYNTGKGNWELMPEGFKTSMSIEIKEGEYYYFTGVNANPYIVKCTDSYSKVGNVKQDIHVGTYIKMRQSSFIRRSEWSHNATNFTCRLATQEEREWLDLCIKEDKFVPKPEKMEHKKHPDWFYKLKYKVGDKILWNHKEAEIVGIINHNPMPYLVHQKEFSGHYGASFSFLDGKAVPNSRSHRFLKESEIVLIPSNGIWEQMQERKVIEYPNLDILPQIDYIAGVDPFRHPLTPEECEERLKELEYNQNPFNKRMEL